MVLRPRRAPAPRPLPRGGLSPCRRAAALPAAPASPPGPAAVASSRPPRPWRRSWRTPWRTPRTSGPAGQNKLYDYTVNVHITINIKHTAAIDQITKATK